MAQPAPFYAKIAGAPEGTAAWYVTAGEVRLRVALSPRGPRGLALILPGRTEYVEKYGQVMSLLAGAGFGSAVIDWRGQGLATRPRDPMLGHVGRFAEYQDDLAAVLALPQISAHPGPRVLIAHSMGGAIGLRALQRGLGVQAAVFTSPMWGIALDPWMQPLARLLARLGTALGLGLRRAPGGKPEPYVLEADFDDNDLTSDRPQYERMIAHLVAHPELGLAGPSFAWADAAFREIDALARLPGPALPVLGFLGTAERVVSADAIRSRFAQMPQARLEELTGARHEPWMETPEIRGQVWEMTEAFFTAQGI